MADSKWNHGDDGTCPLQTDGGEVGGGSRLQHKNTPRVPETDPVLCY